MDSISDWLQVLVPCFLGAVGVLLVGMFGIIRSLLAKSMNAVDEKLSQLFGKTDDTEHKVSDLGNRVMQLEHETRQQVTDREVREILKEEIAPFHQEYRRNAARQELQIEKLTETVKSLTVTVAVQGDRMAQALSQSHGAISFYPLSREAGTMDGTTPTKDNHPNRRETDNTG